LVYFYPKANTPGCTKEACGIRDEFAKFSENNIQVFGVSVDSKEDIKKFVGDYSLNFPLLSDSTKETTEKYGVLGKSGMANRVTFVVDKNGKIAAILKDFDINSHASDVFEIAKKL
jgi:peroxiredoxin Q/BCP